MAPARVIHYLPPTNTSLLPRSRPRGGLTLVNDHDGGTRSKSDSQSATGAQSLAVSVTEEAGGTTSGGFDSNIPVTLWGRDDDDDNLPSIHQLLHAAQKRRMCVMDGSKEIKPGDSQRERPNSLICVSGTF
jgi:hypothetical protein